MTTKRFLVVVNPRGGTRRGLAVCASVKPVFESAGAELDVRVTTHAGHAQELARTIDLSGFDGFCVVGGDGTIHEVVGGLMERNDPSSIPLGVIPGGTGNSVMQHLECSGPLEAARRIVDGGVQSLDIIRVSIGDELSYSINIVGWGAVVDINRTAERLRAIGPSRYTLAALSHILRPRPRLATLVLDGETIEDEFVFVIGCNTKFTGKGIKLAPRAEIDDGKMDVVFVRRTSAMQILKLFRKAYNGSHLALPCVEYHQVRSFSITSDGPDLLNIDGELKGATPVVADIMPAAMRIFV